MSAEWSGVVTPGEVATWHAVYAVAWFQSIPGDPGVVTDEMRATWAAMQATRSVLALRSVDVALVSEVLR